MKVVRLGRAALEAELLRLRAVAGRGARRVVLAAVAALFALFAFAVLHVAAYLVLHLDARIASSWSAVIVAGGDFTVAIVLLIAARAGSPGAAEIEARLIRDRALAELRTSLAIATITGPAARYAGRGAFGLARRAFRRRR